MAGTHSYFDTYILVLDVEDDYPAGPPSGWDEVLVSGSCSSVRYTPHIGGPRDVQRLLGLCLEQLALLDSGILLAGRVVQDLWHIVFTNVGNHPCTLSGGPSTVAGIRADGSQVPLAGTVGGAGDVNLIGPANLQPGQTAEVALTTTMSCAGLTSCRQAARYTAVAVGVGNSGRVRVPFPSDQPFTVARSIEASRFGTPGPPPAKNSSPLNVLTASVAMPRTLTAGTTAGYTVTLHNTASHSVALTPCPSYAEFVWPLGMKPASVIHRYYLNCQAVSQIPANGSITFSMRIHVPATAGEAKYGWALQGTTVEGGGAVSVNAGS